MKKYRAKEPAKWGMYLAVNRLDLTTVNAEGELLDGREGAHYVRLPTPLVAVLSPVLGGVFVLFFPIVIFAALLTAAGQATVKVVRRAWDRQRHLVRLRWEPLVANLDHNDDDAHAANRDGLQDLHAEVDERRKQDVDQPEADKGKDPRPSP